jgi:hypothetical protein
MAATGIVNARSHAQVQRLNRRLDQKIHELRTMLELVRALTSTEADEPHEIAHLLGLTLAGQWAVGRYAVMAARRGHDVLARRRGRASSGAMPGGPTAVGRRRDARGGMAACPLRDALVAERLDVVFPPRSAIGPFGFTPRARRVASWSARPTRGRRPGCAVWSP